MANSDKQQFQPSMQGSSRTSTAVEGREHTAPFAPMYHVATHQEVELEDYFTGPRDMFRHSKLPYFVRMHGSILPKMIIPLSFLGAWSAAITCIHELVHPLGINSVLLTVTGFVVGLALSFRSSTAYERYMEGRKYWAQLLLTTRNLARLIWVHVIERHEESEELGKQDLLSKLAALNLLNAFAVSLKHRLRFEPSTEYPDLAPLINNISTLAHDADQTVLQHKMMSRWKMVGQYLGITFAESNPRKLLKRSKDNLGNMPLEVLTNLSVYFESVFQNKTLSISVHQVQAMAQLAALTDVLTSVERVVNTPLPIAYTISISQITWAYVLALPFQLVGPLGWIAIPGVTIAGYIILGLAQIGRELENPFGQDVNDLPLDAFCRELADDIDALTSRPCGLKGDTWEHTPSAKILWPLSSMDAAAWEHRTVDEIRAALKAKATSRDVKRERMDAQTANDMAAAARV